MNQFFMELWNKVGCPEDENGNAIINLKVQNGKEKRDNGFSIVEGAIPAKPDQQLTEALQERFTKG